MMVPHILIVDDEAPARARLAMLLEDIAADCPNRLVAEADNTAAALDAVAALRPDIVLLDVNMPGLNGLELARMLAQEPAAPAVIFITAHEEHALKAFDVQAVDYLLKPVRAARLAEAIARVARMRTPAQLPQAARRTHFAIPARDRIERVAVADVLYLKAEQKYVSVRTLSGTWLMEESLLSLEEEFPDLFVRVHRNALVAQSAIGAVERGEEGEQVVVRGTGEKLPVSRRQWPFVKAFLRE